MNDRGDSATAHSGARRAPRQIVPPADRALYELLEEERNRLLRWGYYTASAPSVYGDIGHLEACLDASPDIFRFRDAPVPTCEETDNTRVLPETRSEERSGAPVGAAERPAARGMRRRRAGRRDARTEVRANPAP